MCTTPSLPSRPRTTTGVPEGGVPLPTLQHHGAFVVDKRDCCSAPDVQYSCTFLLTGIRRKKCQSVALSRPRSATPTFPNHLCTSVVRPFHSRTTGRGATTVHELALYVLRSCTLGCTFAALPTLQTELHKRVRWAHVDAAAGVGKDSVHRPRAGTPDMPAGMGRVCVQCNVISSHSSTCTATIQTHTHQPHKTACVTEPSRDMLD